MHIGSKEISICTTCGCTETCSVSSTTSKMAPCAGKVCLRPLTRQAVLTRVECQLDNMLIKPARIVHAATLAGVMAQHVALPIFIPADLADRFDSVYRAAGVTDRLFHLHNSAAGNLIVRLWLIGAETMWARINRSIDEYLPFLLPFLRTPTNANRVFETLWTFFHIQQLVPGRICTTSNDYDDDDDGSVIGYSEADVMQTLVREHFERRVVRPIKAAAVGAAGNTTTGFFTWPDDDEVRRFDLWMREYPRLVYRGWEAPYCSTGSFNEDANMEEPEEELYWGSADERENNVGEEERRGKRKRMDSTLVQGEKWPRV